MNERNKKTMLEVLSMQHELDSLNWNIIRSGRETKSQYARRKQLANEYESATGLKYIYQNTKGVNNG